MSLPFSAIHHSWTRSTCHEPKLKSFYVQEIKFEIKHTAHTMDCNDPNLEAFESNLRAMTRGKNAALASNLRKTLQTLSQLENRATSRRRRHSARIPMPRQMVHHLMANLIWTIHRMILKHPQNGNSKGILTVLWANGLSLGVCRGNLSRRNFGRRGRALLTKCSCSCPSYGNILPSGGWIRQGIVEIADSRLRTDRIGKPKAEEKRDRCSWVWVGKDIGQKFRRILFHDKYIVDTHRVTDLTDIWGNWKAIFSCTVRVDPPWDGRDLADITNKKLKETDQKKEIAKC